MVIAGDERRSTVVTTAGVSKDGANALAPAALSVVSAAAGFRAVSRLLGGTALVAGIVVVASFDAGGVTP